MRAGLAAAGLALPDDTWFVAAEHDTTSDRVSVLDRGLVPASHRTDLACGSTIGPITSTLLAIPTVDVGNPMLGMHSAREACGSEDQALMIRVLSRFFAT